MEQTKVRLSLEALKRNLPALHAKIARDHSVPSLLRVTKGASRLETAKSFLNSIGARPTKGGPLGAVVADYLKWRVAEDDDERDGDHYPIETLLTIITLLDAEYEGAVSPTLGGLEIWAEKNPKNAWRADIMLELLLEKVLPGPSTARTETWRTFQRIRQLTR